MSRSVLAIFMEPAPYRTGLIRELRSAWAGDLEVLFIGRNLTQTWPTRQDEPHLKFLPESAGGALNEIRRRLGGARYDLLHVSGWGHPVLLGSMICAAMRRIPIVAETDTPQRPGESLWRQWIKRILYPRLFSLPARFLPAGTPQIAYLKKYGVRSENILQGKLTVDVERIADFASKFDANDVAEFRKRHGVPTAPRTSFLYVGRLEDYKGVGDLLDAYVRLRVEQTDVELLIAGSGSLERFVRDAAASIRSVHYLGHLSGEDVWKAYCSSDVLVLPSRRDSWGLVVNEAMAAGLPVIASDAVGCVDDLLRPGITGSVVRAGVRDSLYKAMLDLVQDPELRQRMGGEGRNLISSWTLAEEARLMTSAWNESFTLSPVCRRTI